MAPLCNINNYHFDERSSSSSPSKVYPHKKQLPKKRTRRSVQFSKQNMVHVVPSRSQYTKRELRAVHRGMDDYMRIRKELYPLVKMIKKGSLPDSEYESSRGLEMFIPQAHFRRHRRMKLSIEAVLRQQRYGTINNEWMADIYRKFTAKSANSAYMRGLRDEQEVFYQPPPPPPPQPEMPAYYGYAGDRYGFALPPPWAYPPSA